MQQEECFIIAIDGPAASGKGTLAQKIAHHYNIAYLDTGLTYRAIAEKALTQNIPLKEEPLLCLAQDVNFYHLSPTILAQHEIGQVASQIAVFPLLRQILVKKQQEFAQKEKKAVLDGRDIGTIVCPKAKVKLFITAKIEIRAQRRYEQLQAKGSTLTYKEILADLHNRDERDKNRKEGPLLKASDAYLLDSTNRNIQQSFQTALDYIEPFWQQMHRKTL